MAVDRIDYVYIETHNWGRSVAFWRALGFSVDLDLGRSGILKPSGGGAHIFLEEVPEGRSLAFELYLNVTDPGFAPRSPVEIVEGFTPTHWGTRVMQVRDPDGRVIKLQDRTAATVG